MLSRIEERQRQSASPQPASASPKYLQRLGEPVDEGTMDSSPMDSPMASSPSPPGNVLGSPISTMCWTAPWTADQTEPAEARRRPSARASIIGESVISDTLAAAGTGDIDPPAVTQTALRTVRQPTPAATSRRLPSLAEGFVTPEQIDEWRLPLTRLSFC